MDFGDGEVADRVSWLDQPSLTDTMASTARIAQGLKEDEEVEKTTFSESLNTGSSMYKHLTVKQIFPREPYRLKVHRDAQYLPEPPAADGFSDTKPPSSYQIPHHMSLDTVELARRATIYASLADSMVASVIKELSPEDQRSKLLSEKLAIIQEAQVSAVSVGFAAASNLQLLRRDALLKNFGFQPQVLSTVRTAPLESPHVLGLEPKVLQNRVRTIRQADRMAGSSVTFVQKPKESNQTSTKKTSSTKKNQQAWTSVFERLCSPSTTTVQRTVSQDQSFCAGAGRWAQSRPFPGQHKKARTAAAASSAGQRWQGAGGGSPGRLCPTVEKSAVLLSSHQHCRGRGWHNFSSTTSAHPSVHQLPGQEQPPGSPAGSGCPVGQGSHREGQQHDFSRVLQLAVPGSEKDRRPSSSNRLVHTEPAHGDASLQDGNSGIRPSRHQKPGVDSLHRHSRRLSPCPNAQGRKKVSAFCGQQVGLPVHLSSLWIGNFTSGVHKATAPSRSSVKTARCQAARLLRRLADPCRYSRTGPAACPDDHQCAPVSRLDHQLQEVWSNTQPGLPVHGDAVQHSRTRGALDPTLSRSWRYAYWSGAIARR